MAKAKTAIKEIDAIEWVDMEATVRKIHETIYHGFEISELPPKGTAKVLDKLNKDGFVIYEFDDGESAPLAWWLEAQLPAVGISVVRPPQNPYSLWVVLDEKKFSVDLR